MGATRRDWPLAAAGVLAIAGMALFWPGVSDYDSVFQYQQMRAGAYTDWHPPAVARLWAVLHAVFGGGAGPMLVLQMLLWWGGLGLLGTALTRAGRGRAGAAILILGCWPPFLGWQAHVLKDAQMAGAALAAVGLVGWWRLGGRRVPLAAWAAVAVLLGYATLVRANAAFALVPLAAMLVSASGRVRAAIATAGIGGVLALSGPVNHGLLGASRSGVEKTQAIYDLAAIAVATGDPQTGFGPAAVRELTIRRCVKAYFWDSLGEQCAGVIQPLRDRPAGALYARLATAMRRHPLAYAGHRLAVWNSTGRWLVPFAWPGAAPPWASEPNGEGLASPGAAARAFERLAGWCLETPLGWPVVGVALAAAAALLARARRPEPARDLALALFASALALEASFLLVSIASDWRYHLWPMLATALGLVLVVPLRPEERRKTVAAGLLLLALVVAGLAARTLLPRPPDSYAGMLAA